jgi:hypothetical protein
VRRLTLCLLLAAVAGATVAAVAVAKVKPTFGSYLGSFTKGESKGLTVRPLVGMSAANGKTFKAVTFNGTPMRLKCKDGTKKNQGAVMRGKIASSGKFSGALKGGSVGGQSFAWTLKGKFTSATTMKGTARIVSGDCDSGTTPFTAKLNN